MMPLRDYRPMLLNELPIDLAAPEWLFEIKYDGYRLMAMFGHGPVELRTRGGANATAWFPEIVSALSQIGGGPHVVDGEVCVLDELGRSDFDTLHHRAVRRRWFEGAPAVAYVAFDLLIFRGREIVGRPLEERKLKLKELLDPSPPGIIVLSHFDDGSQLFREGVQPLQLEGMVAKRRGSLYQPGVRSRDWVKFKRKGPVPPERFRRAKSSF